MCLLCFLFSLKRHTSCLARAGEYCLLGWHQGALHTFEFEVRSWTSYLVGVVSKHLQRHSGSLAQGSVSPLWWEGVRTGAAPVSGQGGCLCTSCPVKEQSKGSSGVSKSSFPFLFSLGLQATVCVIQVRSLSPELILPGHLLYRYIQRMSLINVLDRCFLIP